MKADDEILEKEGFTKINGFNEAWARARPTARLASVLQEGARLRDTMLNQGNVTFYKSIDLIRAPYPTKYGLCNAFTGITPFMHILNRLFIVQFKTQGRIKTLLFSPSDLEAGAKTPYFDRLANSAGPFNSLLKAFIAPTLNTVEEALTSVGLSPDQVDYISYDHLHTQDIRKWLGTDQQPGYFKNAKLLVMEQEWESALGLLPPQIDWYAPNGMKGVPEDRIITFDSGVILGEGVALVQTPGHTEGNHSLVAHTPEGLMVTSENGCSADSYAPMSSRIPGVMKFARNTGMEVILNGNTLEKGLDQYISMVLEKTIAGPSQRNSDFYNFVPSSELTAYWGFPGLKPTFTFGPLQFGSLHSEGKTNSRVGASSASATTIPNSGTDISHGSDGIHRQTPDEISNKA